VPSPAVARLLRGDVAPRRGEPAALVVVGLGNPGAHYARSRHNVGAEVVEVLARRQGATLKRAKEQALVAEVRIEGERDELDVPVATAKYYVHT
jgi:PTH1 family peptidyl-tRNA hydrolase